VKVPVTLVTVQAAHPLPKRPMQPQYAATLNHTVAAGVVAKELVTAGITVLHYTVH
jgi:hypothetical protein